MKKKPAAAASPAQKAPRKAKAVEAAAVEKPEEKPPAVLKKPAAADKAPKPAATAVAAVPATEEKPPVWKRFTPAEISSTKCMARIWGGGAGGQCAHGRQDGSPFCQAHAKDDNWQVHGRVDGPIPDKKLEEFLRASMARKAPTTATTPSPKKKREDAMDLSSTPEASSVKKPVGSAFGIFKSENRESIKSSLPADGKGAGKDAVGRFSKEASLRWKSLSEEEKKVYEAKYAAKMAAYKAAPRAIRLLRRQRKKARAEERVLITADGEKLKKPAGGAYGVFVAEKRESIKASLPAGHKITDVSKRAGALWKALPEDEKQVFKGKYDTKFAAYKDAAREIIVKKMGAGAVQHLGDKVRPVHLRRKRKRAW